MGETSATVKFLTDKRPGTIHKVDKEVAENESKVSYVKGSHFEKSQRKVSYRSVPPTKNAGTVM